MHDIIGLLRGGGRGEEERDREGGLEGVCVCVRARTRARETRVD